MELNVENTNLQVLEPIDPAITIINCSNNRLQTLPVLPLVLIELNCSENRLTELPTLPSSLQTLNCIHNRLRQLPPLLDSSLQTLNCGHNRLRELPTLPPSLQTLNCRFSDIRNLNLPATLLNLSIIICDHCNLGEIPQLPPNVRELDCQYNNITTIGPLPAGLRKFICAINRLTELPDLPDSLVELDCNSNRILEIPMLPNGIEKVDCGFNRISVLPALPVSLTEFICIRNPLTIESFTIFRERFPQEVLYPHDYPEGFVEPVSDIDYVVEPVSDLEEDAEPELSDPELTDPELTDPELSDPELSDPELSDPELTPGDMIEARNIAVQYEVHQAFDKIDLSKIYEVIGSESPSYNPEKLFDFIRELVYTNTLDEDEHTKTITLFEQFTPNIRDIFRCDSDSETKRLLATVLTYVGHQNQEFKNNYIRFFIGDISSSYEYNPEIPDLPTASCEKGIKERIVMSLKSATLGQTEAYLPLLRAFTNKIPIDVMRQFTVDCMNDPHVKELFEEPGMTIDRKVKIVADCIREKLQGTEYFPPSEGAEEIPNPPELIEYIATLKFGFEGGRKTKRKLKKRKTRKLKKRKTKRKIKKSKLSKKRFK